MGQYDEMTSQKAAKENDMKEKANCDYCAYNEYDEEYDSYTCQVNLDEDEMGRYMEGNFKSCPYFRYRDEYKIVRKQM